MSISIPYFRLSSFYFVYFAALGVFIPYWPDYLQRVHQFNAVEIGQLMAVFMATKVIAPLVWGWLADHTGLHLRLIRVATACTIVVFLGGYWEFGLGWMALVMAGFGFFWNAPLPQFEALTLNYLHNNTARYSAIRLWGSIGFIVMVVSVPRLVSLAGVGVVVDAMLVLFVGVWLSTWLVQDSRHPIVHEHVRLWGVLRHPAIWVFLLACCLQQASHGVYYNFFTIYLSEQGYHDALIGWLWALGVIAEVGIFMGMHALIARFGAERLFLLALFLTGLRWVLLAQNNSVPLLLFAQLLHAATYGVFHATAIHVVHHVFKGKLQGRGQALYAAVSYGAGGVLGSLFSGYAWMYLGATDSFYVSAVMVNVGLFLSLFSMVGVRRLYAE